MGLMKKIWESLFPFTGTRDRIYYDRGVPFTGMRTNPTGQEDCHVDEPSGHNYEVEDKRYVDGKVVESKKRWEFSRDDAGQEDAPYPGNGISDYRGNSSGLG